MGKDLFTSKVFGAITFASTTQALKAEKMLGERRLPFIIIPTPREVSASCGLSVKTAPKDVVKTADMLRSLGVRIDGVYLVDREKRQVKRL